MSFWPFAISLLLLIVFVVMWFSVSGERDQFKASAEKAENLRKNAETAREEAVAKFQAVSKDIGFLSGSTTDSAVIKAQLAEYGPKLRDAMTITFPATRFTADPNGGPIEKQDAGTVTVCYSPTPSSPTPDGAGLPLKVRGRLEAHEDRRRPRVRLQRDRDEGQGRRRSRARGRGQAEGSAHRRADQGEGRRREREDGEGSRAQREGRAAHPGEGRQGGELEAARKQASENEAKLIAQANELQGQVRSLVQRDAPALSEGPDGEVVVADNGGRDRQRGRKQWLMPGTLFDVWGLAKGGAKYHKGSIKITSCDDETARGAIIEENARDPITRGDLDPEPDLLAEPQAALRVRRGLQKMGRSQAEAVLTKLGAVVDTKVTAETNYLVVGVPASGQDSLDDTEAMKTAKDLNIRQITEEQLSSFTRY